MDSNKTYHDTNDAAIRAELNTLKDTSVKREDFVRHTELAEKRHADVTSGIQSSKDAMIQMIATLGQSMNSRFDNMLAMFGKHPNNGG